MDQPEEVPGQLPLPFDDVVSGTQFQITEEVYAAAKLAELKEIAQLQQSNSDKYEQLLRQGARPDPAGILMLRINTLLQLLEAPDRQRYELLFEQQMVEVLDECLRQVAQRKLMGPAAPPASPNGGPGGLYIPGH